MRISVARLTGIFPRRGRHGKQELQPPPGMPGRSRRGKRFLMGFLTVGVLAIAACGGALADSTAADLDPAPDFPLFLYQGQEVLGADSLNLSDLQGKPLVLNFWAGLCPPCRAEMPDLQRFDDEFKDRVNLFGLDVGPFVLLGSREDGQELLEELSIRYPAGSTDDESVVRKFEVLGMPTTIWITADGKIFNKWGGALTQGKLTEITEAMLAETAG